MKHKAFEIALSGVSAAIATFCLWLGTINRPLLMTGYLLATVAMMLPLSQRFVWGGVMAYVASSLLAFLLGGGGFFWRLLPYIAFFGLHPLANYLQLKWNVNRYVAYIVKALWFDGMLVLLWFFVCGGEVPLEYINQIIWWLIFVGGTALFYVYDYLMFACQITVNRIIRKIKR
ncbi:MAG: hypothetical protein J5993_01975 [Clostridia bacterium]|nr:hypothetical protein [Clostridia bacterium]